MNEYSLINQITLIFIDVLNTLYVSIKIIYTVWYIFYSISITKCIKHLKYSSLN